jgi:hypothetical protein
MSHKRNFVAALRPEPNLARHWGLRSVANQTWLPVFYSTEMEANAAIRAMNKGNCHATDTATGQ